MSDLAYFEYKTVIPPQGSEREGTPAHYLVDVLIKHPVTGEKREGAELKKLANEHLTLVLNLGVVQLPELKPISESEAKKLNMVRSLGARSDSGVFSSSALSDHSKISIATERFSCQFPVTFGFISVHFCPSVNGSQGPVTAMTPATGGGNGQVWVNSATRVYHKEGSRFYGKTKHGKYMSEQDAIKEGDHAAKNEH